MKLESMLGWHFLPDDGCLAHAELTRRLYELLGIAEEQEASV